jgi:SAM-dependent methyltransferase
MGSQALLDFLHEQIEEGASVLDLGCGDKFYSNGLKDRASRVVTVDAWPATEPDILMDVTKAALPFKDKEFDVVLMLDFIEHIDKEEGLGVITEAQRVGSKIILLTPTIWSDNAKNIKNPKTVYYNNTFNLHRSLWSAEDFKGWDHHGVLGRRYIVATWAGAPE